MNRRSFLAAAGIAPLVAARAARGRAQTATGRLLYVGTYTSAATGSRGIYAWRFDAATGRVTLLGLAVETDNPSFLAVGPDRRVLYAVNELSQPAPAAPGGGVSAFAIDAASGKLTLINRVRSRGINPASLTVDPTGRWVVIANYGSGDGTQGTSVAVFAIRPDGGLDEEPKTFIPHAPPAHPHHVVLSPDRRFLLVAEKGQNRVVVYTWDAATGSLAPNAPAYADAPRPGLGPRHLAFGRDGRFVYVCNEQGRTVSTYAYDAARGRLTFQSEQSTLPAEAPPTGSTAEIDVHPDGRYLYVSNRGHNSLALFAIDPSSGVLTARGHTPTGGAQPRHFAIDPTGDYVFAENQNSALTVIFRIDRATGALTRTDATLDSPGPVCVVFV